jgi:hypothetical protein
VQHVPLTGRAQSELAPRGLKVKRYDTEIGKLESAAPQDLMTEAAILAKTKLPLQEQSAAHGGQFYCA